MSRLLPAAWMIASLAGCRDLSNFTTNGDHFEGMVVQADFVRAGVDAGTGACLTFDVDHLQDTPGAMSTSDGRFQTTAFRSIPQIWHDPLSTLSFGEGRLKNLVYVVTATQTFADGGRDDVLTVVSLMQSGDIELRLIRGAPSIAASDAATATPAADNFFALFVMNRQPGPCSY